MNRRKKQNFLESCISVFDTYPREYYVALFFGVFFCYIVWTIFSYTVLQHEYYKNLADDQQIGEVTVPVTRGDIYGKSIGSDDSPTLAHSVYLSDLAIDPQVEGDKQKLIAYLTETLRKEMCGVADRSTCYESLLRFTNEYEIPDFRYKKEFLSDIIREQIARRVNKDRVTSVLVKNELTFDQEQKVRDWNLAGVYPNENGLYVNPEELMRPDIFANNYKELFGGKLEDILYSVRQRDLRYVKIYDKLSLLGSESIEQYIEDEKKVISQGILKKEESIGRFIILTPRAQRVYPEKKVGSQITGFVDNAGVGRYGIEGYFDNILRGNPGELAIRKDVRGRSIEFESFGEKNNLSAVEGADIYTTIDRNVQRRVEKILADGVEEFRANKGSVVVMQPQTGKVLAMANYPRYDPNNPGDVYELIKIRPGEYENPETDFLGKTIFVEDVNEGEKFIFDGKPLYLREARRDEYMDSQTKYTYRNDYGASVYQNGIISSLYEPGSIMKALTVAIGIDTGEIRPGEFYQDDGELTIDNFTIQNVDDACLGYKTFAHALNFSCNVGMIRIVQRIGKALLYKYLQDFGFGELTGITLDGEVNAKIEPYEKWSVSKLLTTSYGLGISITPLQMANAYSTIANGGIRMKPYIVDSILHSNGEKIRYGPEKVNRVITPETSQTMIDLLVDSIEKGVAGNGAVEGYSVAGKTGTSQIAYKGKYEEGVASTNASFAGFAPAQDPQFTIVVRLERPRTNQYGGGTSAKIFSRITQSLLDYYQIPKKDAQ